MTITPQPGDVWEFRGYRVTIDAVFEDAVYYSTEHGDLKAVNRKHWFAVPKLIERDGEKVTHD